MLHQVLSSTVFTMDFISSLHFEHRLFLGHILLWGSNFAHLTGEAKGSKAAGKGGHSTKARAESKGNKK